MIHDDDIGLRQLLATLDPTTRDALRRVLIHDQADRDAVASQLTLTECSSKADFPESFLLTFTRTPLRARFRW